MAVGTGLAYPPSEPGITPEMESWFELVRTTLNKVLVEVNQLSDLTNDMGTLTAGLIRDPNSRFIIDLDNLLMSIDDEQGVPVTRVEIGELGVAATDWGIRIYDSSGAVLWDLTGLGADTVGSTQLQDGAVVAAALTEGAMSFNTDILFSAVDNDTVQWGAGNLRLQDGNSYSIAAGNTGNMVAPTWIYWDPDVSTTVLQTTTTYSTAVGDRKVILCYADEATDALQSAFFIPAVGVFGINEDQISAGIVATNILKANTVTAGLMSVAQLDAISANMGTLTAGTVRDTNSKFVIDLSTRLITMTDEQGTPQTRIKLGEVGAGASDWGLQIWDASGSLIWDLTGLGTDTVGSTQIQDGAVIASKLQENAQGFNTDILFSATDYDTVAWAAGSIKLADGTSYSITGSNTGNMLAATWIYFDPAVSTTALQTTTTMATAVGSRKIILCYAKAATQTDQGAFFIPAVGVAGFNEDVLSANIVASNILKANTVTAGLISVANLAAINADLGTITAGLLRDSNSKFKIDLDNRLITMIDEQASPVTRIKLGETGAATTDWGIEIYDASGNTILDVDGLGVNVVGNLNVIDNDLLWKRLVVVNAHTHMWAPSGSWIRVGQRSLSCSPTQGAPADGDLEVTPWMASFDDTIVDLAFYVTIAATTGNVRLVVYEDDGSFYPGDLLYESGSTDISTTGQKTISGANINVTGGAVYWIGWLVDITAGTPNLYHLIGGSVDMAPLFGATNPFNGAAFGSLIKTAQSFPAPDPFPAGGVPAWQNMIPLIAMKM